LSLSRQAMKYLRKSRSVGRSIHYLGTRWELVKCFTLRPLYPWEDSPC